MASTTARSSMLFSGSHPNGQIGWIPVHQEADGTPRTWHAIEGHLLSLEVSLGVSRLATCAAGRIEPALDKFPRLKRSSLMAAMPDPSARGARRGARRSGNRPPHR